MEFDSNGTLNFRLVDSSWTSVLSKFVSEKNAEVIVSSNSGVLKQMGNYFLEKKMDFEIPGTCITLKVQKKELGI